MKKRFFSLILAVFMAFCLCSPALALVDESDDFYVADYAGVLNDTTKEGIISANGELESKTGGQIVVVTIKYLDDGLGADEYAVRLFNDWGVGDADKNNGILLLLVTGENKAWLTQGAGITGALTDSTLESLFNRYFWDPFDEGDYDGAVQALFSALIKWYAGYYNVGITSGVGDWAGYEDDYTVYTPDTLYGGYVTADTGFSFFDLFGSLFAILFVIVIVVVFISYFSAAARGTGRRYGFSPFFMPFIFMRGPRPPRPPFRGGFWNGGGFGPKGPGGFGGFGGSGHGGGGFSGGGGFGGGGFGGMGHGGGGFSGGGGFGRR